MNTETVKIKQYFRQAFCLDKQIRADKQKLQRMRELSLSILAKLLPGESDLPDKLKDMLSENIVKIIDLEDKIKADTERYTKMKKNINIQIKYKFFIKQFDDNLKEAVCNSLLFKPEGTAQSEPTVITDHGKPSISDTKLIESSISAALRTLAHLKYTYHGGELWKPPLGKKPNFNLVERLRDELDEAKDEISCLRAENIALTRAVKELAENSCKVCEYAEGLLSCEPCASCEDYIENKRRTQQKNWELASRFFVEQEEAAGEDEDKVK